MSEIKHAFRLMIIDIEKDEIVRDEFAESIVAGIARNDGKATNGMTMVIGRATMKETIIATLSAEKAVNYAKRNTVEDFLKDKNLSELEKIIGEALEELEEMGDEGEET